MLSDWCSWLVSVAVLSHLSILCALLVAICQDAFVGMSVCGSIGFMACKWHLDGLCYCNRSCILHNKVSGFLMWFMPFNLKLTSHDMHADIWINWFRWSHPEIYRYENMREFNAFTASYTYTGALLLPTGVICHCQVQWNPGWRPPQ
jgi:hypothetical protein